MWVLLFRALRNRASVTQDEGDVRVLEDAVQCLERMEEACRLAHEQPASSQRARLCDAALDSLRKSRGKGKDSFVLLF